MKKILQKLLLISMLSIILAACAEESDSKTPTNSAQDVLNAFMEEFYQMKGVKIAFQPGSTEEKIAITNTRLDKADASLVALDPYLVEFGAILSGDTYLNVNSNKLIPSGSTVDVTFILKNPKNEKINKSSVFALLTQDELIQLQTLIPQGTMPTAEQMQAIINHVKPYVVKIDYTREVKMQESGSAHEILAGFMKEFQAMPAKETITFSSNQATFSYTNDRKDMKEAMLISLDLYLVSFGAMTKDDPSVELAGNPISAGQKGHISATLNNFDKATTGSAVCALLTMEELGKLKTLIPDTTMPTATEMQDIIDFLKPHIVKINYTK